MKSAIHNVSKCISTKSTPLQRTIQLGTGPGVCSRRITSTRSTLSEVTKDVSPLSQLAAGNIIKQSFPKSKTSKPKADSQSSEGGGFMGKLLLIFGAAGAGTAYAIENGQTKYSGLKEAYADFVDSYAMPAVRLFDPETAHMLAVLSTKYGMAPKDWTQDPESLKVSLWGLTFPNPIGMSAGFDKHGEAVDGLLDSGFGHVEVGTVTPQPQEGNPKPRMFRLLEDQGVINRYGFNSQGLKVVSERLAQRPPREAGGVMGVNVGKNKTSESAEEDYTAGILALGPHADYLVVNVSCPNQAGVSALQSQGSLSSILQAALAARAKLEKKIPLLVKIGPDLTMEGKHNVARTCMEMGVDGLIVTNTTTQRPDSLQSEHKGEVGGLSGAPLKALSTSTIRDMYQLTQGKMPIVGSGGVGSAEDALEKIEAGASLVQIYSMLVYQGPGCVPKIKEQLAALLKARGYMSVSEAVGAKNRIRPVPDSCKSGVCPVDHGNKGKDLPKSENKRKWWLLWLM